MNLTEFFEECLFLFRLEKRIDCQFRCRIGIVTLLKSIEKWINIFNSETTMQSIYIIHEHIVYKYYIYLNYFFCIHLEFYVKKVRDGI